MTRDTGHVKTLERPRPTWRYCAYCGKPLEWSLVGARYDHMTGAALTDWSWRCPEAGEVSGHSVWPGWKSLPAGTGPPLSAETGTEWRATDLGMFVIRKGFPDFRRLWPFRRHRSANVKEP